MIRTWTIGVAGIAMAAFSAEICQRKDAPEPLQTIWRDLDISGLTLEIANRRLILDVANTTSQRLAAQFILTDTADSTAIESSPMHLTLAPGQRFALLVTINGHARNFSGRLELNYTARTTEGKFAGEGEAASLHYHPTAAGRHLVYGPGVLRNRFDNGNYRGEAIIGRLENLRGIQSVLAARNSPPAAEASISEAVITGSPTAAPINRRFCALMPTTAYRDASTRNFGGQDFDYGEDYGRDGVLPMARILMTVSRNGVNLWSNYADAGGCSAFFPAEANSGYTVTLAAAGWTGAATDRFWYVSDADLNGQIPTHTIPNINPGAFSTVILGLPTNIPPLVVYAVAAASIERFPGGNNNSVFEYYLHPTGSNAGTATDYNNGHPRINIKRLTGAWRSKFTLAHEYGHAVILHGLNPQVSPDEIDYIDGQHTPNSTEWQLIAALEGFANFVSARIWNDGGPNADGVFVYSANVDPSTNYVLNMNAFNRNFETNLCNGNCPIGKGNEQDWAQFFWNIHTSPFPGNPLTSTSNLVSWWKVARPWPIHEGFFADFLAAYLGNFGGATLGNLQANSVAAGIVH